MIGYIKITPQTFESFVKPHTRCMFVEYGLGFNKYFYNSDGCRLMVVKHETGELDYYMQQTNRGL